VYKEITSQQLKQGCEIAEVPGFMPIVSETIDGSNG